MKQYTIYDRIAEMILEDVKGIVRLASSDNTLIPPNTEM